MKHYLLILFILLGQNDLWCQTDTIDFKKQIIGDWYFMDTNDSDCMFDSSYNEISFSDSCFTYFNSCTILDYFGDYRINGNIILFNTGADTSIVMEGEITLIDAYRWIIDFPEKNLNLIRIIDKDYKLSEYIYDNIAIHNLTLKMPHRISNRLHDIGYEHYIGCMKRREMWVRLERNEIDKQTAIDWANDQLKYCKYHYDEVKYKVFIGRVKNIFDD